MSEQRFPSIKTWLNCWFQLEVSVLSQSFPVKWRNGGSKTSLYEVWRRGSLIVGVCTNLICIILPGYEYNAEVRGLKSALLLEFGCCQSFLRLYFDRSRNKLRIEIPKIWINISKVSYQISKLLQCSIMSRPPYSLPLLVILTTFLVGASFPTFRVYRSKCLSHFWLKCYSSGTCWKFNFHAKNYYAWRDRD